MKQLLIIFLVFSLGYSQTISKLVIGGTAGGTQSNSKPQKTKEIISIRL